MTTRRTFLSAGLAAIPVGVGAALGVRHWMAEGTTLRLVGRDDSILALFDTGNERALFLLGDPEIRLVENLSQLLPIGRQRVDMIVGCHQWLTTRGLRDHLDVESITTLSLQASASAPPIRGNVYPVTTSMQVKVGGNSNVMLSVGRDIDAAGTNPAFAVDIGTMSTRMLLASGADAPQGIEHAPDLLVIPGEIDVQSIKRIQPAILAGTSLPAGNDTPAVQVFPDDAITFTVRDGSVAIRENQFSS